MQEKISLLELMLLVLSFITDGTYNLSSEGLKLSNKLNLLNYLASWVEKYPIISIEDGMDENDWSGWEMLTKKLI